MTVDDLIRLLEAITASPVPIAHDTRVLSTGVLDSFHLAAFLQALGTRHGVRVELEDVGADNFDTPAAIHAFVQARR